MIIVISPAETRTEEYIPVTRAAIVWACMDEGIPVGNARTVYDGDMSTCTITRDDYAPIIALCEANDWEWSHAV